MTDTIRFDDPAELPTLLTRLPVAPGDILMLSGFPDEMREDITEAILDHYVKVAQAAGLTGEAAAHVPLLVYLQDGQCVDTLDEHTMRDHGWVRIERVFQGQSHTGPA